MTEERRELISQLKRQQQAETRREGYAYSGAADFLLQHGKWYDGPYCYRYSQGPPKQCYGWAIALAGFHGLKYVEGYALAPLGYAIPHAWNSTGPDDPLIDATWLNTGLAYFGVEFSLERADDCTWNGDACVLDDWQRRWPLFQQPWKGEDYSLKWPPSERIEALRERSRVKAQRIVDGYYSVAR